MNSADTENPIRPDACADVETSSEGYAARFAGPAGQWMLQVQTDATLKLMGADREGKILDVGGGHGQLAEPLCRLGSNVTVLGSDPVCETRIRDLVKAGQCEFAVGDPLALPFESDSFHTVLCFRLVCHCDDWKDLIGELCRVASGRVIIDYPTSQSLNVLTDLLFGLKKKVEGNTRTYTLFKPSEIVEIFEANGWVREGQVRQFFWPMVIHRMLNRPGLSRWLERIPRCLGLTGVLGSPVVVSFIKDA